MTFEEIVDQAMAMLQRRGRVTYRLLKRQFTLDDEALEDLKIELIKGQRLAVDEAGEVLVWTGAAGTAPASPAPLPLHPSPSNLDAERRQLTVLFCDLADSTRLARQLDPEDLREVVRAYQATCVAVIQRFDGYVAQYLGDGLLVYFGYPQAHEDDAQRAVRTGLGILEAMGMLPPRLVRDHGIRLAVRIGIHTGLVVVGEMGSGDRHEHLALGDTPNLAARLQGLAAPNTVVISDATARLVQGYFTCQDHGTHTLKGIDTPVHLYQVMGASAAHSRLDVAEAAGLTPLVGREAEVTLLRERWAQSRDGLGQVWWCSAVRQALASPAWCACSPSRWWRRTPHGRHCVARPITPIVHSIPSSNISNVCCTGTAMPPLRPGSPRWSRRCRRRACPWLRWSRCWLRCCRCRYQRTIRHSP